MTTFEAAEYWSHDARTGERLASYRDATAAEVGAVMEQAAAAARPMACLDAAARRRMLEAISESLERGREELVALADRETGLGAARLNGELTRSQHQLGLYAAALEQGWPAPITDDVQLPATPTPVRLELVRVPLGPVVVFTASNFPFAFSVPGTDVGAALAAGCPVVVKIHPLHPATSEATATLMAQALSAAGAPAGAFAVVHGADQGVGERLVRHPATAAVAFTGSRRGGLALARVAASRSVPVPFFGELGSINPVVIGRSAWQSRGESIAESLAGAILQGYGQFCTSPGLVLAPDAAAVAAAIASHLDRAEVAPMLGVRIAENYERAVATLEGRGVDQLVSRSCRSAPAVFVAKAEDVAADESLREEMFGPACVVAEVGDVDAVARVLQASEGQLTVTVIADEEDENELARIAPDMVAIAGRLIWNGVPTGVAVSRAMHHGGPFPASTDPRSTSVGTGALDRFVRPVCLQGVPAAVAARVAPPAG